jgi:anti-sigma factor RsiW
MSCSPFDLKDYFLKELARPQALLVEEHVQECRSCHEELDRMRLTEAALFALRDEEIPQRIAFVSDPVLEPAAWRRWLAAFWGNGARLGFASVAMLSIAILVSALTRPAPAPPVNAPVVTASVSPGQVQAQIQAAVDQAVRESEERQTAKMNDLLVREHQDAVKMARAASLIQWLGREKNTLLYQANSADYRWEQNVGRAQ